jgi:sulfonate transport system substrate-binding protein
MERTRLNSVFFILICALFFVFIGSPKSFSQEIQNQPQLQKIKFGTQPFWAPTSIVFGAIAHDAILVERLRKLGFEIEFTPFLNGTAVNAAMGNKEIQIGVGGEMPTLSACVAQNTLSVSLVSFGFVSIVARKEMLMSDFYGKTIATVFGTTAHFAMLKFLDLADISITDINVVSMQVTEMSQALKAKKVDAFVAWEPTPQIALNHNENFKTIGRILTTGYLYFDREFATQNETVIREILAAQMRASTWLGGRRENIAQAAKWNLDTARNMGEGGMAVELADFKGVIDNSLRAASGLPLISDRDRGPNGRIATALNFLVDRGAVPAGYNWDKISGCFDSHHLLNVLKKPVTYQLQEHSYIRAPSIKSPLGKKEGSND